MAKLQTEPKYKKGIRCPQRRSSATFIIGQNLKNNHPNWKGGFPHCLGCGKELTHRESKKCRSCYAKTYDGKENPMFGRKHNKETLEKISKTWFRKGHSSPNKGKKFSKETRDKISKSKIGDKHPFWKGGISREPYSFDFDNELKDLIRKRDNYKCRICQAPQEEFNKNLPIHHIDYDKKNSNPDNLITLCPSCHTKTNHKREYWRSLSWQS